MRTPTEQLVEICDVPTPPLPRAGESGIVGSAPDRAGIVDSSHDAQVEPPHEVTESLMKCVRFSLMGAEFLKETVETSPLVRQHAFVVMQAHREEHRRVNEESVRKLLEDQARERESLRKSLRGASARVQTHPRSSGAGDRAGDPAKWPAPGRGGFDAGAPAISAAGVAGTEPRSIRHVDAWRAPSPGVYYYDVPSTVGPGFRSPPRDARGGEHASRGDRTRNREEEEASRKRVVDARAHERALAAPVSARTGPPSRRCPSA